LGASIEYGAHIQKHSAKEFFNKHGFVHAIHDYAFLKKLLLVLIPLTVIFSVITRIWFMSNLDWRDYFFTPELYFNSFSAGLGMMLMTTTMRLGIITIKKKFKYHLARAYFNVCNEKIIDSEQIKLLKSGINFYNQYIKRNSGLQFKNPGEIYSKFIEISDSNKKSKIISIIKSFEKENDLDPLKQIKKSFQINSKEFVAESKHLDYLKEWAPLILGVIATVLSIVNILPGVLSWLMA